MDFDKTMNFQVEREENTKAKEILKEVYQALTEKGYNVAGIYQNMTLPTEADYAIAQENQAIERDKIEADSKNKANQTKTDMLGHVVKVAGTVLAIGANTAWILWTMASEKEGNIPGLTQASKFLTKLKIL